jgi:hypothetical protein
MPTRVGNSARLGAAVADRDIELVLVTGAGASVGLGASGTTIAAMKEWANHLSGALAARDPGIALLVGLRRGMDGMEFEQQLGRFFASARAFRDAQELMVNTSHFMATMPAPLGMLATRPNIEEWHRQATFKIEQVSEVVHETLYTLFGRPSFDLQRARDSYVELLEEIGIGSRGANWVYATTNYDTIGDEALEAADFRVEWGERHRVRLSETIVDPENLLDRVKTGVPLLHLHGKIGWYRRSAAEGGQAIAVSNESYQAGFGTPVVMLPDPNKVYDSDPIINTIWAQFQDALSRARRVLVLGHSLHDDQILGAIAGRADPGTIGVTVYGHPSDPEQPFDNDDPILAIREEHLPESTLIPIRFGETGMPRAVKLAEWAKRFR